MPFRRRRGAERREWVGGVQVLPVTVAVNTIATSLIVGQSTMEEFPGARVALLQGTIFVSPATAPATPSGYGVFLGIYRRANIGGGFPAPDPEVNPDFPWVWWNVCFPQIGGTAAADSNAARWIGYFRFDITQRLRLRWHDFDDLVLGVKNSASSAATIQYSFAFRFLVLAGRK